MRCPMCGEILEEGANFCDFCGHRVTGNPSSNAAGISVCLKCGAELENGDRYCTVCGWDQTNSGGDDLEYPHSRLNSYDHKPGYPYGQPNSYDDDSEYPESRMVIDQNYPSEEEQYPNDYYTSKRKRYQDDYQNGYQDDYSDEIIPPNNHFLLKLIITVIIVAALAVAGIAGYSYFNNHKKTSDGEADTSQAIASVIGGESDTEDSIAIDGDDIEEDTEEATEKEATEETATEEKVTEEESSQEEDTEDDTDNSSGMTMGYTDNKSCNISKNLTSDAFEKVTSKDGDYSFSYPKYVFNHFSYSDEDGYKYWFEDGDGNQTCSMHVYSVEQEGNPLEIAHDLQTQISSRYTVKGYLFPEDIEGHGVGDDGIMQISVSGWFNESQTKAQYVCAGNDGSKTYYYEFDYPDADPDDSTEDWDYVIECAYRCCSFCGSSKSPCKDYNEFKAQF